MRKEADKRTYKSWQAMLTRCQNPSYKKYAYYGGRGIKVCDRWFSYDLFLMDMGVRPPGKTLDRFPNGDGDYEPGNCRWATIEEQNRNKRDNVNLTIAGDTMTAAEWSKRLGISQNLITARVRKGLGSKEALAPLRLPPTHCPSGHAYACDNVFVRKNGKRECRQCMRARCAARRRNNQAMKTVTEKVSERHADPR